MGPVPAELFSSLRDVVGATQVLSDADTRAPFETDWTGRFTGPSLAVVRPGSTSEVVAVLDLCRSQGVPVVPQGGNTSLVGGSVPPARGAGMVPIVLSATRLADLDEADPVAAQITAGAGVTLARVQEVAAHAGLAFPVDLAARQSATIGGMIATNAGGLHVLRYGSMRAQVLGVEAVLGNGAVVSRLSGLVKDNTGYDLSQLLVGSEGTLGFITGARLRLVPVLGERVAVLIGLPTTGSALDVLTTLRGRAEGLEAIEIFFAEGLEVVRAHGGLPAPLPRPWPVYLVAECATATDRSDELFEALAELDIDDRATAVATDGPGRDRLWAYRERHTEAVSALGIPHKLDVTLPLGRLAEFDTEVRTAVHAVAPDATLIIWGHVGDGNLHVNVVGPPPDDDAVDDAVLCLVAAMGGSISAEHGIGRAKTAWLHLVRSPAELAALAAVKGALDPSSILNPGVLIADRRAPVATDGQAESHG
ncbi:MAG: FAD-binding oxidoreductase [Actinomycetota bacterium]|nr:FAD-binding oxidoreductase [Actinomycetota bacterium]